MGTTASSPTRTPFRELREAGELEHTVSTELVDSIILDVYGTNR